METTTAKLRKVLKTKKNIRTILQEHQSSITTPSLHEYLTSLLSSKGMLRQDVIKRSELDSNYINQLFNGIRMKPGRNQILSLAFGFILDSDDASKLLRVAGVGALYPKNKRDAVIIHSLENSKSIIETNDILSSLELCTLSSHKK